MNKASKFLTLALACTLAAGAVAVSAAAETSAAPQDDAVKVYLVPGSYKDARTGETVCHAVDGATKLTDAQCEEIHTPNAYLFTGGTGDALPAPSTPREGYAFNGWWSIDGATVAYHDVLPAVTQTTYYYADWRAALSQPMDPVNPPDEQAEQMEYYLEITRKATGEKERVPLYVAATDVPNAEQFGYGGPVQLYNEWFLLEPGDDFQVYVSRIYSKKPTPAPQKIKGQSYAKLEENGVNKTFDWLHCKTDDDRYNDAWPFNRYDDDFSPAYGYVGERATEAHHFRIYIKFYDSGDVMTMYMENKD